MPAVWFLIPLCVCKVGMQPPFPVTPCAGESIPEGSPRLGLILTLVLFLTGCGPDNKSGHAPKQRPSRDHLVTVFTAERAPVAARRKHPGSLRFRRLVRIHIQEEGRLSLIHI